MDLLHFIFKRGEHKMLLRYKPDDYETKLIILYSIKKKNNPPFHQTANANVRRFFCTKKYTLTKRKHFTNNL